MLTVPTNTAGRIDHDRAAHTPGCRMADQTLLLHFLEADAVRGHKQIDRMRSPRRRAEPVHRSRTFINVCVELRFLEGEGRSPVRTCDRHVDQPAKRGASFLPSNSNWARVKNPSKSTPVAGEEGVWLGERVLSPGLMVAKPLAVVTPVSGTTSMLPVECTRCR